ncbi:hypothetical protein [Rhizobium sp. LC145]|uniref:hypothetical protein n=1 Tax=Rhizobium sp. LC145 TaxID=1120688 RepID=UPI000629F2CE|nr:hypothetical protein [Rhizobium sp. LC145]KKX25331.1 hypothetical protein YH62_25645 [Rhizobium sp. LC145]TKT45354.1 hypothetical protein FDR95_25810 [Rhizobiaceae bacterium LC148]
MSKHTPGPWSFRTDARTGDNGIMADGTGVFVEAFAEIRHSGENARDEALANARLIAAAPDLLQALEDLLHAYSEPDRRLCCDGRDCGCMGSTVHQQAEHYARLAIAKAEGRSESLPLSKGQEEGNG